METWVPNLDGHSGPRYRVIADVLQQDIVSGRLPAGQRLPTHRDLAWKLGVTVGTVTRAYVEAERLGLISGEVGRGTYVRPLTPDYPYRPRERMYRERGNFVDLTGNEPPPPPLAQRIGKTMGEVGADPEIAELLGYRPSQGLFHHREAGAAWIRRFGVEAPPDQVIPTHGAQQAMLLAAAAVLRAGDTLLTEHLTFFGIKSVARVLGLRLHGVDMDELGIVPDALVAAIRATGAKAIYLVPTMQNPTGINLADDRRRAVAEICRKHGVALIEDDILAFLMDKPLAPIATYLPELTLYITNLSKSVAPALRVGYLACPPGMVDSALVAMRASSVMASPLLQETASRLIADGTAWENALLVREEQRERQKMGRQILGGQELAGDDTSFHLWLTLPEPWRREAFFAEAQRRGVGIAAADVFATGRQPVPHAVRISTSAAQSRAELKHGLQILADILASEDHRNLPVI
jgi:DNA-binding transcriptional MocR family regulator